jgi:hypothetical protein
VASWTVKRYRKRVMESGVRVVSLSLRSAFKRKPYLLPTLIIAAAEGRYLAHQKPEKLGFWKAIAR